MPKMLSMKGLYIINQIKSEPADRFVTALAVTDSLTRKDRVYRFDAGSIAKEPQLAKETIEHFIKTGQISAEGRLSYYPTPGGYSKNLTIACFDSIRNNPCLVRYIYAGQKIGLLFYPHQVSWN